MEETKTRPPIVTVLGHVDHGKTTLLDAVRKSNVVAREAGGITQSIGASVVEWGKTSGPEGLRSGGRITFIDTPGHAAFSAMRSRGAQVADIALLVVGGDDGVKPQTKEALSLIKEAKVPFIVVATKMDLPSASVEALYPELEKEGILFEGRGGDTPLVPVSAKKNEGIEKLLEMISLLAEVHGLKGALADPLEAVVIETSKSKAGPQASVVVRAGKLAVGQTIYAEGTPVKVKALFSAQGRSASGGDFQGESIRETLPGEPALVLGFDKVPPVGSEISSKAVGESKLTSVPSKRTAFGKLAKDEIPIFLKAGNAGSLEALVASVPQKTVVISASVGDLTASDVLTAKGSNARVFVFESKVSGEVSKLAETEGVRVERFEIIYDLVDRLEEIIQGRLAVVTGKAEILASFPFNNQKVAGCKVLEGKISKGDTLALVRDGKEAGHAKAVSLKKLKQEITTASAGEEFGVILTPQLDFNIGDVLVSAANG